MLLFDHDLFLNQTETVDGSVICSFQLCTIEETQEWSCLYFSLITYQEIQSFTKCSVLLQAESNFDVVHAKSVDAGNKGADNGQVIENFKIIFYRNLSLLSPGEGRALLVF